MQTYGALFHREIDKAITKEIDRLRDVLEQSHDIRQTDSIRGQIYALRQLDAMMEEAAKAAEQHNR